MPTHVNILQSIQCGFLVSSCCFFVTYGLSFHFIYCVITTKDSCILVYFDSHFTLSIAALPSSSLADYLFAVFSSVIYQQVLRYAFHTSSHFMNPLEILTQLLSAQVLKKYDDC